MAACPLAFGEVGVKTRVKAVLWYKKPAFWAVLAAVVVCAVVAVCFLTNPKGTENEESDQSPASYQNVALVAYQTDTVTLTGYAGDVETTSGSTLGKLLSNADWTFLREGRADDGTDGDYTILAQVNDDTALRFYAAAPGESTVKITAGDESRWYNMGEMGCADVRRALTQTDTLLLKLAAQAEEMDTFDMTWAYGDTLYTDNGIPAPVLTRLPAVGGLAADRVDRRGELPACGPAGDRRQHAVFLRGHIGTEQFKLQRQQCDRQQRRRGACLQHSGLQLPRLAGGRRPLSWSDRRGTGDRPIRQL